MAVASSSTADSASGESTAQSKQQQAGGGGGGGVRATGAIAGIASGLTKLAVGHPFDTIKIRLQCATPGTFAGPLDCLRQTISREGPRALYKGASPPAFGWAASDAVLLGSLHNYRLWLAEYEARQRGDLLALEGKSAKRLSLGGHALAGSLAGCTVCLLITPIEHIKAKLQLQTTGPKLYSGPIDAAAQVMRKNGFLGLWRGFGATLLFRSWFGPMFAAYEVMIRANDRARREGRRHLSDGAANFVAGGMSSNVFWAGSFGFDAVKNRLMCDRVDNPRYRGWMDAARSIWAEGGVKAVYRGFVPCLLRAFPTNASALFVWESVMRLLRAERIPPADS